MEKVRVLIADDDETVRLFLERMRKKLGFQEVHFSFAENGQEALRKVRKALQERRPFHAVLTDEQMPRMGGEALCRELWKIGFRGQIFRMSGDPDFAKQPDGFSVERYQKGGLVETLTPICLGVCQRAIDHVSLT
ncbi:MAG: response regulator [Candidatus Magasanikbacteria bacterium]